MCLKTNRTKYYKTVYPIYYLILEVTSGFPIHKHSPEGNVVVFSKTNNINDIQTLELMSWMSYKGHTQFKDRTRETVPTVP